MNPMLLKKGIHLNPAFETKYLANCGLRNPLCAIAFQRQCLKRNTCGILPLRSNLPSQFVWYLEDNFHTSRIAQLILVKIFNSNDILNFIDKYYVLLLSALVYREQMQRGTERSCLGRTLLDSNNSVHYF
jgi:hypothetical protein